MNNLNKLELRIARLEKQAFLSDMKEKIVNKIEAFKSVRRDVAPLIKKAGSPEKIAKSYMKISKTREYEQAMKELRAQVGPNPIKQIEFLIEVRKNPNLVLDNPLVRKSSLRKDAGVLTYLLLSSPELILPVVLIIGVVITFLLHVTGIKRFASHDKEAFLGTILFGVVMFVIGWFVGKEYDLNIDVSLDKKR